MILRFGKWGAAMELVPKFMWCGAGCMGFVAGSFAYLLHAPWWGVALMAALTAGGVMLLAVASIAVATSMIADLIRQRSR
jgi:hypothetical protein